MSCEFCGNEKASTYAKCSCARAEKFRRQMDGKGIYPEQVTHDCIECGLSMTPQDVTRLTRDANNQLADEYKCPRCETLQTRTRVRIEEKYK